MSVEQFTSYKSPIGIYYLVKIDENVAGMGTLRKMRRNVAEVKRMFIRPEYRGQGLGKALLQKLLNKAKEYQFSKIRLETWKYMISANYIYHEIGFQEIDEYSGIKTSSLIRSYWRFMEKQI